MVYTEKRSLVNTNPLTALLPLLPLHTTTHPPSPRTPQQPPEPQTHLLELVLGLICHVAPQPLHRRRVAAAHRVQEDELLGVGVWWVGVVGDEDEERSRGAAAERKSQPTKDHAAMHTHPVRPTLRLRSTTAQVQWMPWCTGTTSRSQARTLGEAWPAALSLGGRVQRATWGGKGRGWVFT
jgi:hypothetical protein